MYKLMSLLIGSSTTASASKSNSKSCELKCIIVLKKNKIRIEREGLTILEALRKSLQDLFKFKHILYIANFEKYMTNGLDHKILQHKLRPSQDSIYKIVFGYSIIVR